MNHKGVCRTTAATQGLLFIDLIVSANTSIIYINKPAAQAAGADSSR